MIVTNFEGAVVVDARSAREHPSQQPKTGVQSTETTGASYVTLSEQAQLHIQEPRQENAESNSGRSKPEEEQRPGEKNFKLTDQERKQVKELQQRDREVRAHEQAHMAAAGPHARGGPRYEYQTGPDDRQYAIGGEVSIDTSPIPNDPEATIRKASVVRRAALAPREPSPQDRAIAAKATSMMQKAQAELAIERAKTNSKPPNPSGGISVQEAIGTYQRVSQGVSIAA